MKKISVIEITKMDLFKFLLEKNLITTEDSIKEIKIDTSSPLHAIKVTTETKSVSEIAEEKLTSSQRDFLVKPRNDFDISVRLNNLLIALKVETGADIIKLTEGRVLKCRLGGKRAVAEINHILQDAGFEPMKVN